MEGKGEEEGRGKKQRGEEKRRRDGGKTLA